MMRGQKNSHINNMSTYTKVKDKGGSAEKDGNVMESGNVILVMLRRVDCTVLFNK